MPKGIYLRKKNLVSNVCQCGCNKTFFTTPSKQRRFLDRQHYEDYLRKNPQVCSKYKDGRSKDIDVLRKAHREADRLRKGTYNRHPDLDKDQLYFDSTKMRRNYPIEVKEDILKKKIKKQCIFCGDIIEIRPSYDKSYVTCGKKECKSKYGRRMAKKRIY